MEKVKGEIVFATNNAHKLEEIRAILGDSIDVLSLNEIGCREDIPETADTIEGNALMKARYVAEKYGVDCFADDTGLEVEALGGAPGVHTARYAAEVTGMDCSHDSEANMKVLLDRMSGEDNRHARFVTVIALVRHGKEDTTFTGVCNGAIAHEKSGNDGFGYDPVFLPDEAGGNISFAQLTADRKNAISHRGKATRMLIDFLATQQ